ncbi:MAG: hypothetical protein ACTSUH_02460, partial [Candidatus Thorarchaeota archaeon]
SPSFFNHLRMTPYSIATLILCMIIVVTILVDPALIHESRPVDPRRVGVADACYLIVLLGSMISP